jgi:hypothetical protein
MDLLAAFVITIRPGAFLCCSGWDPNFGRALGDPLGPAQRIGSLMWRNFSSEGKARYTGPTRRRPMPVHCDSAPLPAALVVRL